MMVEDSESTLWWNTHRVELFHSCMGNSSTCHSPTQSTVRESVIRETMGEEGLIIFASLRPHYCASEEENWQTVGEPM